MGYRCFDTAQLYENEKEIGEAVNSRLNAGTVARDDIYIIDKLWNTFHRPDLVGSVTRASIKKLKLDYIDMYLMHWPLAFKENTNTLWPRNLEDNEVIESNVDFVDTWEAMTRLVDEEVCVGIGIANFNQSQIHRLMDATAYVPVIHQFECHPYLTQYPMSELCLEKGISAMAYSPLGSPNRPNALTGEPNLFSNVTIFEMAKRLQRTQAQLLIRYQIQRGHCTIPKSLNPKHIVSNIKVFDFELSADDMHILDELNYGRRFISAIM